MVVVISMCNTDMVMVISMCNTDMVVVLSVQHRHGGGVKCVT